LCTNFSKFERGRSLIRNFAIKAKHGNKRYQRKKGRIVKVSRYTCTISYFFLVIWTCFCNHYFRYYEITVIIVYVMIWVVWIVPFIVYCVVIKNQIYILKSNMRDKIWFSCVCYYSDTYLVVMIFLLPVLI
jgi:hypothetical protein